MNFTKNNIIKCAQVHTIFANIVDANRFSGDCMHSQFYAVFIFECLATYITIAGDYEMHSQSALSGI